MYFLVDTLYFENSFFISSRRSRFFSTTIMGMFLAFAMVGCGYGVDKEQNEAIEDILKIDEFQNDSIKDLTKISVNLMRAIKNLHPEVYNKSGVTNSSIRF